MAVKYNKEQDNRPIIRLLSTVLIEFWLFSGTCYAQSPGSGPERDSKGEGERLVYEGRMFDELRELKYWGFAGLYIKDYFVGLGEGRSNVDDAASLGLLSTGKSKYGSYSNEPRADIKQHFMTEFKRLFSGIPFNDVTEGRKEREQKFFSEQRYGDIFEKYSAFDAAEEAYRHSHYGGHAGAIYCHVKVKRKVFPVLYEVRCIISDDLSKLQSVEERYAPFWQESKNLGFSSPENIAGEIKVALTERLTALSTIFTNARKYGK